MKPVIMMVDDEVDLVQVLVDAVRHSMPDYEVIGATSVDEAEDVLRDLEATGTRLALLVVDHILGGHTGLEFLERIKGRFPEVPLMLFTGQAPPPVAERAKKVGAKVLWKPVRLQHLMKEVQALL